MNKDTEKTIDICLLLEGTYPFVRGGVSSWVHQMISGLPEFNFHLIFLGGHPDFYSNTAYDFPPNVVGFDVYFLLSDNHNGQPTPQHGRSKLFKKWGEFLSYFTTTKTSIPDYLLADITNFLGKNNKLSLSDFLYSRASWEVLTKHYLQSTENQSFVDYFWTYRGMFQPLFILAQISRKLPQAKVFHSISTGYAGFLGALCKQKTGCPFILSEHGIYTKERKIDLAQAGWIKDHHSLVDISLHRDMDLNRRAWITFFEQLGLTTYHQANEIVALFEGNRQRQLIDGAPQNKTQVIVNGIDISRFNNAYLKRPNSPPMVAGLVGRVVPIKDIKTFIRTIRNAVEQLPQLEGWIIGPKEEDPEYVHECTLLIDSLGLTDNVKMLGNQNVAEILPKLGVMMLTSISEAQPLVLLEAMAAGVPCIATEVGACREIIEGTPGEDNWLGSAGKIIPIASPLEGAQAIIQILGDAQSWRITGDIGKERVTRYYNEQRMYNSYRTLYQEAINGRHRI
ncbi:GT4 family glycosyltransferase PelF [Vibrio natriegens]|uniref:GT4 family glycosyltransferase PelF n=1 Tax=Vibrio natriegens TaxID=691 RepID=UPI002284AEEA|nr:GT4 family glycosyltransferase PelF [Vibrio natriegens]MCY9879049.1 GT4 family glycosyltransferase PelF [Vibrio natriegens]